MGVKMSVLNKNRGYALKYSTSVLVLFSLVTGGLAGQAESTVPSPVAPTPTPTVSQATLAMRADVGGNLNVARGVSRGIEQAMETVRELMNAARSNFKLARERIEKRDVVKTEAITIHLGGSQRGAKQAKQKSKECEKQLKQLKKIAAELKKALKKHGGDDAVKAARVEVEKLPARLKAFITEVKKEKKAAEALLKEIKKALKEYNKLRKKHPELNWIEPKGI